MWLSAELRSPGWLIFCAVCPAIALVLWAAFQPWVPPDQLFRDALRVAEDAAEAGGPCCEPYMGLMSNLGIMLWSGTSAVCIFTSLIVYSVSKHAWSAMFFLYGGALTGWLAIDDLYLVHEIFWREGYFLIIYALLAVLYIVLFWRVVARKEPFLLGLSLAFFGLSIFVDRFHPEGTILHRVGEDGTKFIGISAWSAFHVRAAWLTIVADLKRAERSPRAESVSAAL